MEPYPACASAALHALQKGSSATLWVRSSKIVTIINVELTEAIGTLELEALKLQKKSKNMKEYGLTYICTVK